MKQATPPKTQSGTRRKAPIVSSTSSSRRKKVNKRLLEILRGAMLAVVGLILIFSLVLLILPLFRVRAICVEGADEAEAALIESELSALIGKEIFSIDGDVLSNEYIYAQKNLTKFGYIKQFKLHRGLNSITIEILARNQLAYAQINNSYYLFNADGVVLATADRESDFAVFPKAKMPAVSGISIGSAICYGNIDGHYSYIGALMRILAEEGLSERITSMDFSQKYGVSYVLDGCAEIKIGSVERMETKLRLVDEIVARQGDSIAERYVIDVSDIDRPSYRPQG